MPELPEVETVRQTLRNFVLNRRIESIELKWPAIIEGDKEAFVHALCTKTILEIDRKGKYLIFILDDVAFVSHLRMEGKYLYEPRDTPLEKHSHVIFHLDNNMDLRYHDVRKFGRMSLTDKQFYRQLPPLNQLGKEPFDLTADELHGLFRNCHLPIKAALLDQSKIAGLGNIYANEVLYRAGIHPLSPACDLSKRRVQTIINMACDVLEEAIRQGGTTIRSFSSNGIHGLFSQQLDVHGRDGQICHRCGYHIIKRKINTRTAYYCPKCQKIIRRRRQIS